MKGKKNYAAFGLACLLVVAVPATALAAASDSPEFARTPEEWARLRDDRLEYDEIADLIHEYNTTVINNRIDYRDYLGKERKDISQKYRDAAKDIRDNIEFPTDYSDSAYGSLLMAARSNEDAAKNLEEMADNNVDDAQVVMLQYQLVEENLVQSTKLNLIAYYQKLLGNRLTQENQKLLDLQYEVAVNQASAGTATQLEVLNAQQAAEQLASTALSDERETVTLRQKICVATGWKHDAQPEFGELPTLDPEQILAIDLEADKASALENNYTLKINRRKLDNSTSSTVRDTLVETIRDNEQKIASDVIAKYSTLLNALSAYEVAQTEQVVAAQNLAAMEIKFQTGMASRLEYQQEVFNVFSKEIAVENAELTLFSAWVSYEGAVNGLASTQ